MATRSLGVLTLDLVAKIGGFEKGMDQAARLSEKRLKQITTQSIALGNTLGTYLTRSIDFAASKLIEFTKGAIDAADEVSKLSQKTGLSTEALSELQYAAGLSGVEDLGASLIKFNRSIAEAAQGSKAQADAFKALGISVKNADGSLKGTEQLLGETADAFAGVKDGANKTAVAMDLFGKTGAELIPFLNEGKKGLAEMRKEAVALGLSIDEYTGKAAEQFNDNLDRLGKLGTGVGTRLATDLAQPLAKVTDYLVQAAKEGDAVGSALEGLRAGIGIIVVPLTGLWNLLQTIVQAFVAVGAAAGALARRDFAALEEIGNAFGEDRKRNIKDVTAAYELFFGGLDKGAKTIAKVKKEGGTDLDLPGLDDDKLKKAQESIEEYLKSLGEEVATNGASRAQIEARKLAIMGATQAQQDQGYQLGAYLTLLDDQKEKEQEAATVLDSTRTAAEKYAEEIKKLNDLKSRGLVSDDTVTRKKALLDSAQLLSQLSDEQAKFARQQQQLDLAVQTGLESKNQAEQDQIKITRESIAQQSQLADALERVAIASGDTELQNKVKDLRVEIAGLGADIDETFGQKFSKAFEDAAPQIDSIAEQLGTTLGGALSDLNQGIGDIAAKTILWGESATESLKALGRSILENVVSSLIQMGVQMAANFVLGRSLAAASLAATAAEATAAAGLWAPAAIGASIATFGTADAVGLSSYLAALSSGTAAAGAAALAGGAGFAQGGYTGDGGLGNVAGVVHGKEAVVSNNALRAAADAMNDPKFWGGEGGGSQLEVRNMGEPMDARMRRVGRRVVLEMIPIIEDGIAAGVDSRTGSAYKAQASAFGLQSQDDR